MRLVHLLLAPALSAAVLFACSSQEEPRTPTPPPAGAAAVLDTAAPQTRHDDPPEVLSIASGIREACGITQTETYFAYNSAAVEDTTTDLLRQVVACFTTGPLRGRELRVVGHTDPRGDEEYNYALGGRRAAKVQERLESLGFADQHLSTSSRGESDAQGTDEASWRNDRRVELALGS